jgi:hypothetical protein
LTDWTKKEKTAAVVAIVSKAETERLVAENACLLLA